MNYGYVEEIENKDIVSSVNYLEREAESAGNKIAEAFQAAIDCVEDLTEALESVADPIEMISNNLDLVAQIDFGEMANDLSEISDTLTDVLGKLCETDWVGIAGLVMQAFSQGFDVFTWLDSKKLSGLLGDVSTIPIKTEVLPSNVMGAANFAEGLEESTKGTGLLSAGFDRVRKALDGVNLSQIAATASQWIQNAAMTAWEGICKVATFVTSGLGTAMNFLTSPITLVVLGIAALIAIVVLLVKNWDTVKAALITGWEAVKQAFSVAGEWFNTNVIQPLVGFFTGLWNQICVIVTNVTTFISTKFQELTLWIQTAIANVQAVFMGIDAYLQGVFATDWTNQFGAFGEVLNAFFANVENIWNAVKTIFNGIVDFVKGVFAGDWQKGRQREAVCFRKCCKGAMLPKADDPRRRVVGLIMIEGGCLCGHERGGLFF